MKTPPFVEALDDLISDYLSREDATMEEVISEMELKLYALREQAGED